MRNEKFRPALRQGARTGLFVGGALLARVLHDARERPRHLLSAALILGVGAIVGVHLITVIDLFWLSAALGSMFIVFCLASALRHGELDSDIFMNRDEDNYIFVERNGLEGYGLYNSLGFRVDNDD